MHLARPVFTSFSQDEDISGPEFLGFRAYDLGFGQGLGSEVLRKQGIKGHHWDY